MTDAFHYTIRAFDTDDAVAVQRLIAELQDSLSPLDESLPPGAQMASAYYAQTMERCREQAGAIFVADAGGEVVGFVVVLTRVPFASADAPPGEFAFVTDLAVTEAWRRRGIGTELLAAAENAARSNGARELRLDVLVGNPAIDLYRQNGLTEYLVTMRKRF